MMAERLSSVCGTGGNDGFRGHCERRMFEEETVATTTSFCLFFVRPRTARAMFKRHIPGRTFVFKGNGYDGDADLDDSTALLGLSV
jgi:hypothetical protein